jgi:hypothetical protein
MLNWNSKFKSTYANFDELAKCFMLWLQKINGVNSLKEFGDIKIDMLE